MNRSVEPIATAITLPAAIGRFEVLSRLGGGAQGVVYLARDPQLERKVAVKTLVRRGHDHAHLIQEARNVSKLEHPNIIPIHEIGVHEGAPYLVYQYCEGQSLRHLIAHSGKMTALGAVNLMRPILDAIGYAHRCGIVHRDLTPANIMVDNDQVPHIMDFGISLIAGTATRANEVIGTVAYMAPEQIANGAIGPSVDIFALGAVLFEMLTAQQAFAADNPMAVMFKISNENVVPPSRREPAIEPALDAIVLKALARDAAQRYPSADAMKTDLDAYAAPESVADGEAQGEGGNRGAVDFLMRRIRRKPDFPAISTSISQISTRTSGHDNASVGELSNIILKDYALTTKLLRLVNASFYGQFGRVVSTVSRAIVVLGFEQVRAAAFSIMLFDHMKEGRHARELKGASCHALMSAMMAREQAGRISGFTKEGAETAFIASMFHNLGRHLTIYYFPEEFDEIRRLVDNKGVEERQAALSVLGTSYEALGMAVAREWHLPDVIVNCMQRSPEGPVPAPRSEHEAIAQLAHFGNALCALGMRTDDGVAEAINLLTERYGRALGTTKKSVQALIERSQSDITEFARVLNVNLGDVSLFRQNEHARKGLLGGESITVVARRKAASAVPAGAAARAGAAASVPVGTTAPADMGASPGAAAATTGDTAPATATAPPPADDTGAPVRGDSTDLLIRGIAEITEVMLNPYNLNDVLTMVLENIYRGMGFTRVLFCVRDHRNNQIKGRFGFGKEINAVIEKFRFAIGNDEDIFTTAVREGKDFIVHDTNSDEYRRRIPPWVRELTSPRSFVVYPLILKGRCIGLIYADTDDASTEISSDGLRFFKLLRNQACLAIQQSRPA